jgi:hypothetical protein
MSNQARESRGKVPTSAYKEKCGVADLRYESLKMQFLKH